MSGKEAEPTLRGTVTRRRTLALGMAGLAASGLAACSGGDGKINSKGDGDKEPEEEPMYVLGLAPADGSSEATAAAEITWDPAKGEPKEVKLAKDGGEEVAGEFHPDGTSWIPSQPLEWEATYTATVTAEAEGEEVTGATTFTVIASPESRAEVQVYSPDNTTVGQAAVVYFEFVGYGVPEEARKAVERRLFVTSEPAQEASWHWINASKLEYRPKEYWKPGTAVSWRLALGGVDFGDGTYGQYDLSGSFTTDTELRKMVVDDSNKRFDCQRDGASVNQFPTSLGAKELPDKDGKKMDTRSYTGNMIIMSREKDIEFSSAEFDYEDIEIDFGMRLTWNGQYIHSAPWAKDKLGKTNGSHGCINLDTADAEWVYEYCKWGDPIEVKNTGRSLPQGDGVTSWDLSWEDVLAGSYLTES